MKSCWNDKVITFFEFFDRERQEIFLRQFWYSFFAIDLSLLALALA